MYVLKLGLSYMIKLCHDYITILCYIMDIYRTQTLIQSSWLDVKILHWIFKITILQFLQNFYFPL